MIAERQVFFSLLSALRHAPQGHRGQLNPWEKLHSAESFLQTDFSCQSVELSFKAGPCGRLENDASRFCRLEETIHCHFVISKNPCMAVTGTSAPVLIRGKQNQTDPTQYFVVSGERLMYKIAKHSNPPTQKAAERVIPPLQGWESQGPPMKQVLYPGTAWC